MSRSRLLRPAASSHDVQPFSFAFTETHTDQSADAAGASDVAVSEAADQFAAPTFLDELFSAIDAIDELSSGTGPSVSGSADVVGFGGDRSDVMLFNEASMLTDEYGAATVALLVRMPEWAAADAKGDRASTGWSAGDAPTWSMQGGASQFGASFATQISPIASDIHALDCAAGNSKAGFEAAPVDAWSSAAAAATAAEAAIAAVCSCCAAAAEGSPLVMTDDYVVSNTKWGTAGLGTSGGTVTWSIAGAGLTNQTPSTFFSGSTVSMSSVFNFDYQSVLTQAFAAWSAVANINFVQVADGGGNMGVGTTAYIRLCAGYIDGNSNVLARAYYPATNGNAQNYAYSGDTVFDSGESSFWTASSLLAVATHEIGHAIGLNHATITQALMAPYYNPSITTPQADDIAGARAIYGTAAASTGSVSINDVTVTEGNSGTLLLTFTVTRTGGTAAFSVNYATANGTATAGSDYVARSGTLSFGTGVNTQTVSITINGDTTVESSEYFYVNLSGATNGATISDSQGVGTINNDDAAVAGQVSINDVTITEGNAGTQIATFTVTRAGGTAAFSVNYATAGISALAGSDYAAASGTLSFGANVNTQTISITIYGDTAVETNETFAINLSSATNGATIADSQGIGTIVNDDSGSPGAVSINDVTITEGDAGTQVATFTVTRTGGTAAFSVNYATANGTASSGSDFAAASGTLNFGTNVTTQTVSVTIYGDTTVESNETFFVNLSSATNGATIADSQGAGTIVNDDSAAVAGSVSINDVIITEGNAGTQVATFTVTRTGGSAAFTVGYATANNSAIAGSDYVANSGTLSFATGVNTQTVSVTINGDSAVELDETFFVNLSGATNGATITDSQGVGTIVNDDSAGAADDFADSLTDFTAPFGTITNGAATGNLETTGDRDWFQVSLTAGTQITVDLLGLPTNNGTLIDPYLRVYNSAGTQVTENDDVGGGNYNSRLTYTPSSGGTYYIAAGAYSDTYTGTYTVRVTGLSGTDDYADNFTDVTAPFGAVAVGGFSTGRLETAGDRDWFRVTLVAGIAYTFDLKGAPSSNGTLSDPYLYLYNSAGNFITLNDDSGSLESQITYTATASGSYYLSAAAYNDAGTGTYRLNVTQSQSSVPGGSGDDVFFATASTESFAGMAGNDTVSYANQPGPLGVVASLLSPARNTGWAARDTYSSIENLTGTSQNDTLTGDAGNNILEGGAGGDKLDGGLGFDTASYVNALSGLTINLTSPKSNTGEAFGDTYKSIERVLGSNFDDVITGGKVAETLLGRNGNDVLSGGAGIDTLTGGADRDTFRFGSTKEAGDTITDFTVGEDLIGIVKSGFKISPFVGLGVGGIFDFANEYFVSNTTGLATASGHGQFVFNTIADQLLWDPDGIGRKAAIIVANFSTDVNLRAIDFDLS